MKPRRTPPGPAAGGLSWVARLASRSGVIVNEHTLGRQETVAHVDVLSRWFDFISLDEFPERAQIPSRRPFCLLTFDDGKKSNATITAPLLQSLGVPAAFYVVTDFVSGGRPLWFDAYRALVDRLGSVPGGLDLAALKALSHVEREIRVWRAVETHGVDVPLSVDVAPMCWEDIRWLAAHGFAVGAHGRTHAILTREPRDAALAEIAESLERVGAELGRPCQTFAFPNGNHDLELARHAQTCGATTVMTTDPTWVGPSTPFWRLPRIQLYSLSSERRMRAKIALALVPGALGNPDGTGRGYYRSRRMDRA
jgi:peptidoglycan/xylan/chitin deacetylase (PgdA/CDA1 family)